MQEQYTQEVMDDSGRIREAKRAYYRAWAKKNPDKVKATRERFWARQAERMKEGCADDS